MPFCCSYDSDLAMVTLSSVEPVGFDQFTRALDAFFGDLEHVPPPPILIDLRTLREAHVVEARTFAKHLGHRKFCRHTRLALLVSCANNLVVERALAMYMSHEGLSARLFTDDATARVWLAAPII